MFDTTAIAGNIPIIFLTLVAIFVSILYKDAKKHTHDNTKDLPYYNEIAMSIIEGFEFR